MYTCAKSIVIISFFCGNTYIYYFYIAFIIAKKKHRGDYKMKILSKNDFNDFVDALIADTTYDVHGVQAKGDTFVFDPLESAKDLRLDYDTTILSPKKYFLPQYETMMEFHLDDPFNLRKPEKEKPRIIIGVHPYDIVAIQQMDIYFLDSDISKSYLDRRKNTIIIGSDVLNVHEKAFFGIMETGTVHSGYDLLITDLGNRVSIEIGSVAGAELLKKANRLHDASPIDGQKTNAVKNAANQRAQRGIKVNLRYWHDILEKNYNNALWEKQSDKCLACGTCTLVCPTCFCYDVLDYVDLDSKGKRIRTWDGCLLRQFTEVASGEVFRDDILDRYRHRFFRKGNYLPDRLGFIACVGCGRCSTQCIPDIADPVNLMNLLFDSSEHILREGKSDKKNVSVSIEQMAPSETFLHDPVPATIKRVEKVSKNDMLFEIELDSGKPLNALPGQFVEISLMGVGEAPISISSPPGGKRFELVIRKIGNVTKKLHDLKKNDKVGIRGPFGKGFNLDEMAGKDLLFIAGGIGIVPLRALIKYVLDPKNRNNFGKITILYGCKEPCELLFGDEVSQWAACTDVTHLLTVDKCAEGECWDGDIGLITKLIPKVPLDVKNTLCYIVGPPVMYPFCIQVLRDIGLAEENIIVSLERRMKCGVGKCGHCQINKLYVCKEGPVFYYKDIKDLPEAFK